VRFHHVNLGVDVGGADAESGFLTEVLGLRFAALGPEARATSRWFEAEDGCQVHLSEDPEHRPAARAHVAMEVGDEWASVLERLEAADIGYEVVEVPGRSIALCRHPNGNRWELRRTGA
jgi:catechol 2,3-dioxygenase-like lactoylglutathione lyase family enzyme